MRFATLGQSGIEASRVALGAWAIGGWMWGGTDEAESVAAIHAGIDAGITLIDTAPIYGFGRSERIVGKAIADRRDRVVLATKCGLRWDATEGVCHFSSRMPDGRGGMKDVDIYKYLGAASIKAEVEASLKRLGTDVIDLIQTHWQDPTTPIAETMAALVELKDEGKVRAIGASNATSQQMGEYWAVAPLDTDQEKYSMLDRGIENDQLPFARDKHMAVLAYSPLAMGLLTGKVGPERTFNEGDLRRDATRFSKDNRANAAAMLDELRPIAEGHDITLAQLAVAWTLAQPGLTHALVGARRVEQALENAAAADVELTESELAEIERILTRHDVE